MTITWARLFGALTAVFFISTVVLAVLYGLQSHRFIERDFECFRTEIELGHVQAAYNFVTHQ